MTVTVPKTEQKKPEVKKTSIGVNISTDLFPQFEDMPSEEYIKTARYLGIKDAVIKRAKGTCQACTEHRRADSILPRPYADLKSPFLCDHVAVCSECGLKMVQYYLKK